MANRFIKVNVTRQTKPVTQQGFGLPLILSTEGAKEYREYTDIAPVGAEFGVESKTYKLAAKVFGGKPRVRSLAIYGVAAPTGAGDLSAALNELKKTQDDYFFVLSTDHSETGILDVAEWTSTQAKLYVYATDIIDLPSRVPYENAMPLVHNQADEYPEGAWVGDLAPRKIGSYTGTFKTLNGVLPVTYDETTINNIHKANGNTYIREGGVNLTSSSKTGSGEFVDTVLGSYYIEARMTENLFGMLVRQAKLPYTYAGLAMATAMVEETLREAANLGIIAKDATGTAIYTVTMPELNDISDNDKANRVLPDIPWTAVIEGAIESITVNGVLTLSEEAAAE